MLDENKEKQVMILPHTKNYKSNIDNDNNKNKEEINNKKNLCFKFFVSSMKFCL